MPYRFRWFRAESEEEAKAFQAEANRLVGQVLADVVYVTIDHVKGEHRRPAEGPRHIVSPAELERPTWQHPSCDTVDYAVQFTTVAGDVFTASWETPGIESIGLRECSAIGRAVTEDARTAVWPVADQPTWSDLIGKSVDEVLLSYQPWSEESNAQWCEEVSLRIGGARIRLLLAEGEFETDRVKPAANNIAVIRDQPPRLGT